MAQGQDREGTAPVGVQTSTLYPRRIRPRLVASGPQDWITWVVGAGLCWQQQGQLSHRGRVWCGCWAVLGTPEGSSPHSGCSYDVFLSVIFVPYTRGLPHRVA